MLSSSRILRGLDIKGWRTYYPRAEESEMLPEDKEPLSPPEELPDPGPPLPTREEIEQERKAIMEQARKESEEERRRLLKQAKEEAAKLQEQARKEGYARGYGEGEKAAQKLKKEAEKVLEEARREHREILARAEPEIIQLAVALAEKLLNYELEINTELILGIVSRCLEALPGGQEVIIRVNPGDEAICREKLDILAMKLKKDALLEIVADADIQPGCCKVETEESEVTFLLARELEILGRKLLELAVLSGEASYAKKEWAAQL